MVECGKEDRPLKKKQPVSLNIKNPEVHTMAARLAKLQGTSITQAVLHALKEELRRQQRRIRPADEIARMEAFSHRLSRLPVLDHRPEDEILGYGPGGYPNGH
jgi:antitoxin VapB